MTLPEIGAYTLLLCYDWNETGLPNDMAKLARWVRLSRKKFEIIWNETLKENFELREGRWYNPRLEREREKQQDWRDKSARGGRASAQARSHSGATTLEPPLPPPYQPKGNTPSPTPSPVTTKPPTAPPARGVKAKYPHFPVDTCGRLWKIWCDKRGLVNYGTFRMYLAPLYSADGAVYTEQQLADAILCFAEYVAEIQPTFAKNQNIKAFAEGVHGWVRLGGMKNTTPDGMFTERYRVLEKAGAWKVA